jgi:hypothetical protein
MPSFYSYPDRGLTETEMKVNASYIYNYLTNEGWSLNAICGLLGNTQTESSGHNPGLWEFGHIGDTSYGYGLVQWTPSTKYTDWCNARGYEPSSMDSALKRIIEEVATDTQWGANIELGSPPYDFETFTHSTESPYTLAMNFLHFYERPQVNDQPQRGEQANYWYEFITGGGVIPVDPTTPTKKKYKFYLYQRRKNRI